MFSLTCTWTNGRANNRDAGDLKHHRAHYDVTVIHHAWVCYNASLLLWQRCCNAMCYCGFSSWWLCYSQVSLSHRLPSWGSLDDVIKWKHFPCYWPFVRGIHRFPVNSPHKGQWRGALIFSLICVRINGWVNNREAGDLRRYRAHYDVSVMVCVCSWLPLDSFMSCLHALLGFSTGEFQALQLIVLAACGAVD